MKTEQEYEWVSVSEMARRIGVSTQTIYLRIKAGIYETQRIERGSSHGWIIKTPKIVNV